LAEPTGPAAADYNLDAGPRLAETLGLLLLSLVWLAATLWTAYVVIAANAADPTVVAGTAALALPVVVAATLLAGAAAGLAACALPVVAPTGESGPLATRLFARIPPAARAPLRRLLFGAAAGALCGAVAGGLIRYGYGGGPAVGTLAGTVVAAGLLGGASAVLRRVVLAAAVTASLGVFLLGVVISRFQSPLKSVLGAGATLASQANAATWLAVTTALISGVLAGLVGYAALRYRRPEVSGLRWLTVAGAGAFPGLLLLVAEAVTAVGGSRLFSVVQRLSPVDRATLSYLAGSRLNQALVVAFVGAITAMIAIGRTLPRADDGDDVHSTTEAAESAATDEAQTLI
jgi:hypothetical protein